MKPVYNAVLHNETGAFKEKKKIIRIKEEKA
jgi:hypothetical protein